MSPAIVSLVFLCWTVSAGVQVQRASAQSRLLYGNDFESPKVPVTPSCATLNQTPIDTLYGRPGFSYQQADTVEAVNLDEYGATSEANGRLSLGMLSSRQDDKLALTFDVGSNAYVNVAFDLSSIDVPGCGGPFGVAQARMRISLLDSPGGAFGWNQRVIDSVEVQGSPGFEAAVLHFTRVTASLETAGSTDGHVSVVFDLVESGYAAFDNLSIVAANAVDVEDRDMDGVPDDRDYAPDDAKLCGDVDADGGDDCARGAQSQESVQPTEPAEVAAFESQRDADKNLNVVLGPRLGYGIPSGDVIEAQTLSRGVVGVIPATFDLTARLRFGLEFGLMASLGLGIQGEALEDCDDCAVWDFALGAQVNYHVLPGNFVDPWIGAGIGVEALYLVDDNVTSTGLDIRTTTTYVAFPTLMLQGGVDLGSGDVTYGPFVSLSFATFGSASTDVECIEEGCSDDPIQSASSDIPDNRQSSHSWLVIGGRVSFL